MDTWAPDASNDTTRSQSPEAVDEETIVSREHRQFLDRFKLFMQSQELSIVAFAAREAVPVISVRSNVDTSPHPADIGVLRCGRWWHSL